MNGLLAKDRIVATPGFNRWVIIPAALLINLSIGSTYAFSVFNLPLTRLLGVTRPTPGDWRLSTVGWVFTIAYAFLGLSSGFGGKWQDRVGPRVSGLVASLCFGSGFFIGSVGVVTHQIWLLYLGYGVVGGCGLGLGYNTPVTTLIRWFPDHRGLATGMAIMGFGGGAVIAAPLSQKLMAHYATATSAGVADTFMTLGVIYFVAMVAGSMMFRLPPSGWHPAGLPVPVLPAAEARRTDGMPVEAAVRARQFYLLWCVLLLNVTAGVGVLSQASAMIQEMFEGFNASGAALFVALLSVFNMCGRFVWASLSDTLGRKTTYALFFSLGPLLYAAVPIAGHMHNMALFVGCFAVILSMYGGSFASMPAYIADLFGPGHVGAIHGRVLTALSLAGIAGAGLVNYMREFMIASGTVPSRAYDDTMFVMATLLVIGFFCNFAVHRVDDPEVEAARSRRIPLFTVHRSAVAAFGMVAAAVVAIFASGVGAGWLLGR